MRPLRTKAELLQVVLADPPTRAVGRAIEEGGATLLGGFSPLGGLQGWVFRIQTRHGREWIVAVLVDEIHRRVFARVLDEVPWSAWQGSLDRRNPLFDGEVPEEVARMKETADGK